MREDLPHVHSRKHDSWDQGSDLNWATASTGCWGHEAASVGGEWGLIAQLHTWFLDVLVPHDLQNMRVQTSFIWHVFKLKCLKSDP